MKPDLELLKIQINHRAEEMMERESDDFRRGFEACQQIMGDWLDKLAEICKEDI